MRKGGSSRCAPGKNRRDPAADDATLGLLLALARLRGVRRFLEIGTAEGLTSAALLLALPQAEGVTVECDEERHARAVRNFADFGVAGACGPSSRTRQTCCPRCGSRSTSSFWTGRRRSM